MSKIKKILVLIDLQKDFLESWGSLYIGHDTTQYLKDLKDLVDNWDGEIYIILDSHSKDSCEFTQFPAHCIKDTEGQKTYDWVMKKACMVSSKSTFVSYSMMQHLAVNKIDKDKNDVEFHFAGVLAHICVIENIAALYHIAKKTYNVLPKIKVDPKYVDDLNPEIKAQALERMKNLYAVEILENA